MRLTLVVLFEFNNVIINITYNIIINIID